MESFDQVAQFRNADLRSETVRIKVPVTAIHEESVYETIDGEKISNILAYKDNSVLCSNLRLITESPAMCDVTFLVGRDEVPVYGVKALLATRSSVFYNMIFASETSKTPKKRSARSRLVSSIRRLANPVRKPVCKSQSRHVYRIPEFEPSVFRPLISYLHSGDIHVDVNNVIGVMIVADAFHIDDLRVACLNYARECITKKTVLQLLVSTQPFFNYKWTKILNQEIMTYICKKGQDLIRQPTFFGLNEESVSMILSRPQLRATEESKWDAALRWTRIHCSSLNSRKFRQTLRTLTQLVNFCDMSMAKLRTEIQPLRIVPDDVINRALSYQICARVVIGQVKESGSNKRSLSKQKGFKCLANNRTGKYRSAVKEQFPIQPLASSTFNNSKVLGLSDSGYVLSFLDPSFLSKL